MNILALDTCTESCSAALLSDNQIHSRIADAPREHSQRILPMVDEVLKDANISIADVQLIAYGRGPGSFTGIRICTSMTQGLALGQNIPVIGISTLATMAQMAINTHDAEHIFCSIDARMNEVYWAQYKNVAGIATLIGEEQVSSPDNVCLQLEENDSVIACGTGFDTYPQLLTLFNNISLSNTVKYPDASAMITLAQVGYKAGKHTCVDELAPVYLRDTVTWKKLPGRE